MSATETVDDLRERLARVTRLAYQEPPPGWALRDVALPLLLDMWAKLNPPKDTP